MGTADRFSLGDADAAAAQPGPAHYAPAVLAAEKTGHRAHVLSRHPVPIDRPGPGPSHLPKRTQGKARADFGAGGAKDTSSLPPRPRLLRSVTRMRKWVHAVTAPTCSMPGDLMNIDARHHANRDGLIGDTIYGSGSGSALRLR